MSTTPSSHQSGSAGTAHLAIFELRLEAVDRPTDRRRWNGGPMPSEDADAALHEAVEAFRAAIECAGFEVARIGYGVKAQPIFDA